MTEKYAKEWIYDVNKIKEYRESIKTQKKEELKKARIEQKQYNATQLQPLPPIVEISDEEAFKDTDGNILHIKMRGEKTQEGLYMKALDIQHKLGIDRVYDGVTHTNSDYEYNTHYVFFETQNYGVEVDLDIVNYRYSPSPETPPPEADEIARCCFANKFLKYGEEWVSGIEKRCGFLAGKPCEDTLVVCDTLNKNECAMNNVNCVYDDDTNVCNTIPNGHDGREIECTMYDRMKNMEFDYMEYN